MYDQSCPTLNQERPRSVKISKRDKLLSETLRQLQGLIKQRVETVVTIFDWPTPIFISRAISSATMGGRDVVWCFYLNILAVMVRKCERTCGFTLEM